MADVTFFSIIAVFLGGGIGSLLRFGISKLSLYFFGVRFPYGTLVANLIGAALAGYAAVLIFEKRSLDKHASDLLLAGFLGGLTTFSSMVLDAYRLHNSGSTALAVLYVALNIALGFLLFHWAFVATR